MILFHDIVSLAWSRSGTLPSALAAGSSCN